MKELGPCGSRAALRSAPPDKFVFGYDEGKSVVAGL